MFLIKKKKKKIRKKIKSLILKLYYLIILFLLNSFNFIKQFKFKFIIIFIILSLFFIPVFKKDTHFLINDGESINSIALNLKNNNLIYSKTLFKIWASVFVPKSGYYYFEKRLNLTSILYRFNKPFFGDNFVKITVSEGSDVFDIANLLKAKGKFNFDEDEFLKLAKKREGYLFPDTYFINHLYSNQKIIDLFEENFKQKTEDLDFSKSNYSKEEIIIIASILEKEVKYYEDKRYVADVINKRLKKIWRLEVDASSIYIKKNDSKYNNKSISFINKNSSSPYNSYKKFGLPPGPISNPGLESIRAVLNPELNEYLFYISLPTGNTYFASSLSGHQKNIVRHLRK